VANGFGRMPVPPEMNAFEGKVGRDQGVLLRPQTQHGAVVSNSGEDLRGASAAGESGYAADPGDQRFFG